MDVDMRSPSFRTHRSGRQKRTRSPPSPSPYERPAKRQSIAGTIAVAPFPQPIQPPPAMWDRQISEDWVTRTRSLSIGKDAMEREMRLVPLLEMVASGSQDENMNMDHDVSMHASQFPSRSQSSPTSIPSMPAYPTLSSLSSHSLSPTAVQSSSPSLPFPPSSSSFSNSFQSSTFSHDTPRPFSHQQSPSIPSSLAQSPHTQSPDIMQAPQSHVQPFTPAAARKQRFTMGPRADCEKCRLGVPGHWMHFD